MIENIHQREGEDIYDFFRRMIRTYRRSREMRSDEALTVVDRRFLRQRFVRGIRNRSIRIVIARETDVDFVKLPLRVKTLMGAEEDYPEERDQTQIE